jgi:hypothetical protein
MQKPRLNLKNTKYKQGYYKPLNESKYIGNNTNIIYRSNMELLCFRYMDNNSSVLKWGSEIIKINYFDTSSNKKRIYFIDLYAEFINKNNTITKAIIEIKPSKQTQPPKPGRGYDRRSKEYMKNISKWNAAKAFAKSNGLEFIILTEEQLR